MRALLHTPVEERERGAALVLVIGLGALVMALVATLVVVAVNGARYARDDADWNGALAAAYAGIEEYQSRLAEDPAYYIWGNPAAPFSQGSALAAAPDNPAFGIGGTWATVPGSEARADGPRTASYRYELDSRAFDSDQLLRLRATGRVGQETRSVIVDLRQAGFAHYLYFTDLEIADPALSSSTNRAECYRYGWSSPVRPADCGRITFDNGDTVNGMVHSNDVIWACSATFKGRVSTAWNPTGSTARYRCGSGATPAFQVPDAQRGNSPFYQPVLPMPETNTEIRAAALQTGCIYSGPTSIELRADGRMLVKSPLTRQTRPGQAVSAPSSCGTPAQLASSSGALVNVPAEGAVYVQNVPSNAADPNYRVRPANCASGNALGYPRTNEQAPPAINRVAPYDCHSGDLFVSGTLDGEVTLASENFIYIVGNVVMESRDDDMLGLIGNSMVYVWNPSMGSSCTSRGCLSYSPRSPAYTIEAAILSLRSFAVQNTDVSGTRNSSLTVYGSISQAFRGVVSFNSGYRKDYNYDPRMRTQSPPHFLSPTTIAYGVSTWIETPAAFSADGAVR
ncbi:hypothetical protein OVA14_00785 [Agrococcus sp. SL85]|uniref:hypothetical protein n=1 Tax=Agrococcus sp. SL85 TaxID=2995141 RepID=UPI00226CFC8A|nr:hypothetical protein [Agrococcus sp. SL85]WAC66369.1 hypothetical protein OVA14_00785 [Agrococcus sp. SL85]